MAAHELLRGPLAAPEAAAEWRARCGRVFRWSQYFDGPERRPPTTAPAANGGGAGAALPEAAAANGLADGLSKASLGGH